jgi:hypothetical protein
VRRKVIAGTAAALAAVGIAAIAIGSRGNTSPAQHKPLQAKPSQQFGDDADLMRRLERKKLTTRTTR